MTLSTQFITILTMIAGGVYLGAALDTFHRFKQSIRHKKFHIYIFEVCFWLLQTLILFYLLFLSNQGELRFYIFVALMCGFAAYMSLFKVVYNKILNRCISITVSIIRYVIHLIKILIIYPITRIFRLIITIILSVLGILTWIVALLVKVLFYPFKLMYKLIERMLPENVKKMINKNKGFYSKIKNRLNKWWKIIFKKK